MFHADGRSREAPIALCEVQGYAYLARMLAHRAWPRRAATRCSPRGSPTRRGTLRENFEAQFWGEELGTYVLALDGDKQPCRVRTSNAGQVLFTGIARRSARRAWRTRLSSSEFFRGWGIRTVSARERRFNPASYHNGSVWPHDNALIALGLARYGHTDQAARLTTALFDAAAHMHLRRLPELFCGFRRRRGKAPMLYPVACAPQAWAACTPFALMQACLGLEIDAITTPRAPALSALARELAQPRSPRPSRGRCDRGPDAAPTW